MPKGDIRGHAWGHCFVHFSGKAKRGDGRGHTPLGVSPLSPSPAREARFRNFSPVTHQHPTPMTVRVSSHAADHEGTR